MERQRSDCLKWHCIEPGPHQNQHRAKMARRSLGDAKLILAQLFASVTFVRDSVVSMSVSAEEVAKHNKDNDCWVIVGDQVLDVTNFLSGSLRTNM